jgi:CBS domain-containing protein
MNKILVSDVYHLHDSAMVKMDAGLSLEDAIGALARNPSARGIFLLDSEFKFAGLITRVNLLRWAHLNLSGGRDRQEIPIAEFFKIVNARKARDLAGNNQAALSVKETDTLHAALDKMLDAEEDVLAVLDNEDKVLGDLRLSEVLNWIINSGKMIT